MPYSGPYPQTVQTYSPFAPRSRSTSSFPEIPDSWACDYCKVATFRTYEETLEHEKSCSMNQTCLYTLESTVPGRRNISPALNQSSSSVKRTMVLALPSDKDSLSDRQCYVRSHFVELFEADEVAKQQRHSKGAQKLHVGQIGLRCIHCSKFLPKDRAERSVCYPSSISRIYQTVADMQRFHFESCSGISHEMKNLYRSLKTTRPRGGTSPQNYWIESAKALGLVDTPNGIRFAERSIQTNQQVRYAPSLSYHFRTPLPGDVSPPVSPQRDDSPIPLTPDSESRSLSSLPNYHSESSDCEMLDRDFEANMLLALKNPRVSSSNSQHPKAN